MYLVITYLSAVLFPVGKTANFPLRYLYISLQYSFPLSLSRLMRKRQEGYCYFRRFTYVKWTLWRTFHIALSLSLPLSLSNTCFKLQG